MRRRGLARNIALRMALVTLCGFAIATLCAFFLYSWVFENHPDAVAPPHEWVPQTIDYLVIAASAGAAVLIAVLAGGHLARRLILPLNALAEAARRIAADDLTARARVDDRSLDEIGDLAGDFNRMAERLEDLTRGMVDWNASIAHELRTPVTILKGRLQGVADGVFTMDDRTLTSLLRQVDGLARLVEDLRVVSLADSGHLDLRLEYIDLADVVDELRAAAGPGLEDRSFVCDWRLAPVRLAADSTRLRQATLALLENARVHAEPGRLVISSGAEEGVAFIAVEDSGPGLSDDLETGAFEPFRRSGSAKGSGLGLSVVRAVAEAHGGAARYVRNGAGSTFRIELPLRKPD